MSLSAPEHYLLPPFLTVEILTGDRRIKFDGTQHHELLITLLHKVACRIMKGII